MRIKLTYNLDKKKYVRKYFLSIHAKGILLSTLVSAICMIYIFSISLSFNKINNTVGVGISLILLFLIFFIYLIFFIKMYSKVFVVQAVEGFEKFSNSYFEINEKYLILNRDVIEEKLYWDDIEKVDFFENYIILKYKTKMLFVSAENNIDNFLNFQCYVKKYYKSKK